MKHIRATNKDEKNKVREKLKHARSGYEFETDYSKGEPVYRWCLKKNYFDPTWDGSKGASSILLFQE